METLERYRRLDDRSKDGYAKLEIESITQGTPGKVDLVPPFDIHAEQGGPGRSYGLILRSERVAGKVLQGNYDFQTGAYRRVEGPTNVLYEITGYGELTAKGLNGCANKGLMTFPTQTRMGQSRNCFLAKVNATLSAIN